MAETRKLATILALDVAGYSRAAEHDDAAAAESVRSLRVAVADVVAPFGGRIFNTAGDGIMLEFPAASSGVQAAIALLAESRSGVRPLPRIRIGLHLGEVIVADDGDLLGHGVNVAARLQALAEPGSALVSEAVRSQVRSTAELPFEPQGRVQLDKMSETLAVFALGSGRRTLFAKIARRRVTRVAAAILALTVAAGLAWTAWRALAPDEESLAPRLAVLRFESQGDTEPYFAEGLADELITEATRIAGLEVIARTSSFALTGERATPAGAAGELGATLVMTGSVRELADAIRVQAQLVEAPGGRQLWSETFERPTADVYALQREVAARVASAAGLRAAERPTRRVDPEAYRLYLEGLERRSREDIIANLGARDLFRAAVDRDPQFADGWAAFAEAEQAVVWAEGIRRRATGAGEVYTADGFAPSLAAADRAIALDPSLPVAYGVKIRAYSALGRWDEAAAVPPAGGSLLYGHFLAQSGRMEESLRNARRFAETDPFNPLVLAVLQELCGLAGDIECSLDAARRLSELQPDFADAFSRLVSTLLLSGREEEARILVERGFPAAASTLVPDILLRMEAWLLGAGPPVTADDIVAAVQSGALQATLALHYLARMGEAEAAIGLLPLVGPAVGDAIGSLAEFGEIDAAVSLLPRVGAADRPWLYHFYAYDLAPLRARPEFWALMEREGLLAYWRETGRWPDFCAAEPVCPRG